MKRMGLEIVLVGLLVILPLSAIACAPLREAHAGGATSLQSPATTVAVDSCFAPVSEATKQQCAAWEQQVLASTVRLEIRVFSLGEDGYPVAQIDGSVGHAAVKDGRYLVTHNHYGVSLVSESAGTISRLSLFKTNGEVILTDTPLSAFQIAFEDAQMLVLDFGETNGLGLFGALGVASASFQPGLQLSLDSGLEVAQIDWDGATAHVDWVRVTAVHTNTETPYLELDNYVEQGASGGGIYFNGIHIGNNWSRSTDRLADTGEIVRQYSIAALNSTNILVMAVQ